MTQEALQINNHQQHQMGLSTAPFFNWPIKPLQNSPLGSPKQQRRCHHTPRAPYNIMQGGSCSNKQKINSRRSCMQGTYTNNRRRSPTSAPSKSHVEQGLQFCCNRSIFTLFAVDAQERPASSNALPACTAHLAIRRNLLHQRTAPALSVPPLY